MLATTTLAQLRKEGACFGGYNRLVRALQGKEFTGDDQSRETHIRFKHDAPIALTYILERNGLDDALWALCACEQTQELKRAERLFGVWCARQVQHLMTDQRSLDALDVAERFANGEATEEELAAARAAAWGAAEAAKAARAAAWGARAAARVARAAASDAAWSAQKAKFIEMFGE